jgi:nickel-type superoxide dismutase maturation protease
LGFFCIEVPLKDPNSKLRLSIHLAVTLVTALAAVVAARVRRVVVRGSSMLPAFAPGDRLIVVPVLRLRRGDVVALTDPREPSRLLVKRVASVDPVARVVNVLGDNRPASTDSRAFGPVPWRSVVGRAVYRYGPPGREGRVEGHCSAASQR